MKQESVSFPRDGTWDSLRAASGWASCSVPWDQCCWVAAEPCSLLASGVSDLELIVTGQSWLHCHAGISLYGRNCSLPAGISFLLCPRTLDVCDFDELAQTTSSPVWEVCFHLRSSRPCDIDLRVNEHKENICVLSYRVFGAGQICKA